MMKPLLWLAAVVAVAAGTGVAHADPTDTIDQPDLNGVVCGMYEAGVPPGQIPGDLRRNDARVNSPTLPFQVFQDLQNC